MLLHLKIIGLALLMLALIHIIFPRYFNWKSDLKEVSTINRQMMYVHTFFIALGIFLMGLLCLTSGSEISGTVLGKKLCLGLGIFWATRLVIQFIGYSPTLWKGKLFETAVHIVFSFLWMYFSGVFLLIYFS